MALTTLSAILTAVPVRITVSGVTPWKIGTAVVALNVPLSLLGFRSLKNRDASSLLPKVMTASLPETVRVAPVNV